MATVSTDNNCSDGRIPQPIDPGTFPETVHVRLLRDRKSVLSSGSNDPAQEVEHLLIEGEKREKAAH